MGKAAILVVPVTVVVLGLILWGIIWMVNRGPKPTKFAKHSVDMNHEAYLIFRDMLVPSNIDNMDILTLESTNKVKAWTAKYRKVSE